MSNTSHANATALICSVMVYSSYSEIWYYTFTI